MKAGGYHCGQSAGASISLQHLSALTQPAGTNFTLALNALELNSLEPIQED
jgi:hypothetical protein